VTPLLSFKPSARPGAGERAYPLEYPVLTELDPGAADIAFGLCDLGLGFPELGSVSLDDRARSVIQDGQAAEPLCGF
jgi:hypothetical protein